MQSGYNPNRKAAPAAASSRTGNRDDDESEIWIDDLEKGTPMFYGENESHDYGWKDPREHTQVNGNFEVPTHIVHDNDTFDDAVSVISGMGYSVVSGKSGNRTFGDDSSVANNSVQQQEAYHNRTGAAVLSPKSPKRVSGSGNRKKTMASPGVKTQDLQAEYDALTKQVASMSPKRASRKANDNNHTYSDPPGTSPIHYVEAGDGQGFDPSQFVSMLGLSPVASVSEGSNGGKRQDDGIEVTNHGTPDTSPSRHSRYSDENSNVNNATRNTFNTHHSPDGRWVVTSDRISPDQPLATTHEEHPSQRSSALLEDDDSNGSPEKDGVDNSVWAYVCGVAIVAAVVLLAMTVMPKDSNSEPPTTVMGGNSSQAAFGETLAPTSLWNNGQPQEGDSALGGLFDSSAPSASPTLRGTQPQGGPTTPQILVGDPSAAPSMSPTGAPTRGRVHEKNTAEENTTEENTEGPLVNLTWTPNSNAPSMSPTASPTSETPTQGPTPSPTTTFAPTKNPTPLPTNRPTPNPTPHPTEGGPTRPPTDMEYYAFSLLPYPTIHTLYHQPNSPQARAYQWLIEDMNRLAQTQGQGPLEDYRLTQRFALAAFYYATHGEDWHQNEHWLDHDTHECHWFSVGAMDVTDGSPFLEVESNNPCEINDDRPLTDPGVFRHVWLPSNNLGGTLPPEMFWLLTSLKSINLDGGSVAGSFPEEFDKLTSLEALSLQGNQFGSTIPTGIYSLSNLSMLRVAHNELEGSLPTELGMLTNLNTLVLGGNPVMLGSLPTEMMLLTHLTMLSITEMGITGTIPSEIGLMTNLEGLHLSRNLLTGLLPTELGQLRKLLSVDVSQNHLSGAIPSELGMPAPMTELHLYDNHLTGSIPSTMGRLRALIALDMGMNRLVGSIPPHLGNLSSLDSLRLAVNFLTGTIPTNFGNFDVLGALLLQGNYLTGPIPAELGRLSSMYMLHLEANALTGTVPEELSSLPNLNALDLGSNKFHGEIPEGLCSIASLTFNCSQVLCGCECECRLGFRTDKAEIRTP